MDGISLPDLPNQVLTLKAKVLAACFSPGRQLWKQLTMHLLAKAAPSAAWVFFFIRWGRNW